MSEKKNGWLFSIIISPYKKGVKPGGASVSFPEDLPKEVQEGPMVARLIYIVNDIARFVRRVNDVDPFDEGVAVIIHDLKNKAIFHMRIIGDLGDVTLFGYGEKNTSIPLEVISRDSFYHNLLFIAVTKKEDLLQILENMMKVFNAE